MKKNLPLYVKSAACSAWFRLHGFQASLVACDGQLPVLTGGGNIRIGRRFVVRGRVAPCELTAEGNAQLLIGERVFLNQGVVIEIGRASCRAYWCSALCTQPPPSCKRACTGR